MAEVGARFALDGMPGKQLAIDSDLASGAISHEEARIRRENEQSETSFFGSLDGASKFVKGDAIAGLLITLLNLVAGVSMGIIVHDMSLTAALETYSILTVGDGLVSQIPAVIISISSALLLARGKTKEDDDQAIHIQLSRHPHAFLTVSVLLAVFALFPGLPFLPFALGSAVLALLAVRKFSEKEPITADLDSLLEKQVPEKTNISDVLDLDEIQITFSPTIVEYVMDVGTGLDSRIDSLRTHVACEFGLLVPPVHLTDDMSLNSGQYKICIHGVEMARGTVHPGYMLILDKLDVNNNRDYIVSEDPVYGAPATWVPDRTSESLSVSGKTTISCSEVIATHLLEVIKTNLARILTDSVLSETLNAITSTSDRERNRRTTEFLERVIPDKVSMELLLTVLRLLLEDRVSIRNLPLILEAIMESKVRTSSPETICEHVRHRLGFQIVSSIKLDDGTVPLIQLSQDWEELFERYSVDIDTNRVIALPPDLFSKLGDTLAQCFVKCNSDGISAALVASTKRRKFLSTIMKSRGLSNSVISFDELGYDSKPNLINLIPV